MLKHNVLTAVAAALSAVSDLFIQGAMHIHAYAADKVDALDDAAIEAGFKFHNDACEKARRVAKAAYGAENAANDAREAFAERAYPVYTINFAESGVTFKLPA